MRRAGIANGARPVWRERSRGVRLLRLWRTRHPVTFTEKVRYKMLRDHRQLMVTFADKAAVRGYVASVVGADRLPRVHHLLEEPSAFAELSLPDACVLKPTHGSGAAVIISDAAPGQARLPEPEDAWVYRHVRPDMVNSDDLVALARAWLAQLYGSGPNREWVYGHVPRRILVEELLLGPAGQVPDDYKCFVFHGVCRYIQVDQGRFANRTQDFFTPDWAHLSLSGGHPWSAPAPAPPHRLSEMLEVAEQLGVDTDFVRVDLYLLRDRIVVGELTSFPAAGDSPFEPASFDAEFGRHWAVPRRYR
jgi:hypothetical protein